MRLRRTHRVRDRTDRESLQLRQYVTPEVNAVERSIVAPRRYCTTLVRCGRGATALRLRCHRWIVTRGSHAGNFRRTRLPERRNDLGTLPKGIYGRIRARSSGCYVAEAQAFRAAKDDFVQIPRVTPRPVMRAYFIV
jgi:hypothetical protein